MKTTTHIVWLKRDLRLEDHPAFTAAAKGGAVVALAVYEPSIWGAPDASGRHAGFYAESLAELGAALHRQGVPMLCAKAEIIPVLDWLHARSPIELHSHEETGNALTYARDLAVARWCRQVGVRWHEQVQNNVVRRLRDRDRWAGIWEKRMAQSRLGAPAFGTADVAAKALLRALPEARRHGLDIHRFNPAAPEVALAPWQLFAQTDHCPARQPGGRKAALELLASFLDHRALNYRRQMSSPLTGEYVCSRLSAHLAWGTLSIGETVHRLRDARSSWASEHRHPDQRAMLTSLRSFESRLHWRCHFMQKLESEPELEWRCLFAPARGVRNEGELAEHERLRLQAWADGQTGVPFVDACMRYLRHGGWLNFRMRAMLMSFASHHLWLHWRLTGEHLARQFVDYEPGIHWPQAQMQSGTTGINTVRIYNPEKQWEDQDPDNRFVDRWVPERLSPAYPQPIVDLVTAGRQARDLIWGLRKTPGAGVQARQVFERHGSRKPANRRRAARRKTADEVRPLTGDLFAQ